MTTPPRKLYGSREIAIISCAMLAGIVVYLFRRYHETGHIGMIEIFSTVVTAVILTGIAVIIVRKANKPE